MLCITCYDFVVVPSVPDGMARNASRGARVLHRKAFCTRVSRLSKMVVKQKMVVFKDTPKYRSGGNVRSFKQASFAETGS